MYRLAWRYKCPKTVEEAVWVVMTEDFSSIEEAHNRLITQNSKLDLAIVDVDDAPMVKKGEQT